MADNTALSEAQRLAETVIPVFILEEALQTGPDVGAARLAFLLRSLESLQKNLAHLGHSLVVRKGRSEIEIPKLCQELGVEAVFANKRYEPYAQARDNRVFNQLNSVGVGFELFKDAVLFEEREILNLQGAPYTVFTPYSKAWLARKFPTPRRRLVARNPIVQATDVPALPLDPSHFGHPLSQNIFQAGEHAALEALNQFLAGPISTYQTSRDFPGIPGTSRLSAHLRAGTIGIRTVVAKVISARETSSDSQKPNYDAFLKELIWREFYLQILHNFPHVTKGCFRPEYDQLAWENNERLFEAWQSGQTGYPIVDAAMRCLGATGWMHNRLRMVVSMFLTKDLLISWQWGERYFMKQLVDGDMAANNGGWQWSAGTGTDAAPYFRIFNPSTQGQKFDPNGGFIRQWAPELAHLPNALLHEPWKAGSLAPLSYPPRIVLHEQQRRKCLEMFEKVRSRKAPKAAA